MNCLKNRVDREGERKKGKRVIRLEKTNFCLSSLDCEKKCQKNKNSKNLMFQSLQ